MKGWYWFLIGVAAGVGAAILLRRMGATFTPQSGLGGGYYISSPNPLWFNLPTKPVGYLPVGWQPPTEWKNEARKLAKREHGGGLGALAFSNAMPYQPVEAVYVEYPVDWKAPRIDPVFASPEQEPF